MTNTVTMRYVKLLGVTIDNKLNWHKHLESTSGRLIKTLFVIRQLKYTTDEYTIKTVDYRLFNSVMIYCIIIWGDAHHSC